MTFNQEDKQENRWQGENRQYIQTFFNTILAPTNFCLKQIFFFSECWRLAYCRLPFFTDIRVGQLVTSVCLFVRTITIPSLTLGLMTIPHSLYEMHAQGITLVDAFLKDIMSMMKITSIIPSAQVLWGEWPITSSTNRHICSPIWNNIQ